MQLGGEGLPGLWSRVGNREFLVELTLMELFECFLEGNFGGVFWTDWEKIHVVLAGREREGFISKGRTMAREGCF
jgi:hypothetical protein